MNVKTPLDMFTEMVGLGYIMPASVEPSRLMTPTAYISVPTSLVYATPPVPVSVARES